MNWAKLNPNLLIAAIAAVYLAGAMLWRAFISHDGVFEPDLLVAAFTAVSALVTHTQVTPVAQPRDNAGNVLVPASTQPPTQPPASAAGPVPPA